MDPRRTVPTGLATRCAADCKAMPEISAPEREFWRRAVAAERARLALCPVPDASPVPAAN